MMSGVMTVVPTGDAKAARLFTAERRAKNSADLGIARPARQCEAGKVIFARACIVCHKIGEAGVNFAPNLNQVCSRLTREQIIKSILEPSAEIASGKRERERRDGRWRTYTGLIDAETGAQLKLRIGAGLFKRFPVEHH